MENTEVLNPVQAPEQTPQTTGGQPQTGKPPKPAKAPKPKKKRKWLKPVIIIVVIVAILAIVLSRCMASGQKFLASTYIPVQATMQDMTVSVSGTGTIEPIQAYRVTTLVQGEVLEAPFEEGDTVQEGDLLFRIDAKSVESAIQQQEINLQNAQLTYNNLLKNQQVTAGASGTIAELYVEAGDTVTAGTPIADILDRTNMELTVPFHSADAARLFVGESAQVMVGGTMETLNGTIKSISATDTVGAGGTLVRNVVIRVTNPGVLTDASTGSATVGSVACAASGTFAYGASQQVVAKTSGDLTALNVKEGDRVSDGQVLATIDSESLESARLAVESAQLSLQNAQNSLEDYTITAPFTGEVIEKNLDVGDNVSGMSASATGGTAYAAVIYDRSQLTFEMEINERDISKIEVGQTVEITADALDGESFTGVVDKINITGTTANGNTTYPVTVLVENAPEELYPGMNVSATILVEHVGNVLALPVEAVDRGDTVLVALPGCLDENGAIVNLAATEERQLTLGRNDDNYIEVLSGLEEGETVLMLSPQGSSLISAMTGA